MRVQVVLECSECKIRNYTVYKNKELHPERLEYKKFCKQCNKHTIHRETR